MPTQDISVNFTLTGNQTHADIGYRPLGSSAPFTFVTPAPTVSPYVIQALPMGLYEISVSPACDKVLGPPSTLVKVVINGGGSQILTPPSINSAIELPGTNVSGTLYREVSVSIYIPPGVQAIEWYIGSTLVRTSMNTNELFSIPDPTWSLTDVTIAVRARYSSTQLSSYATVVVPLAAINPTTFVAPVPTLTITAVTDTGFTSNVLLPSLPPGVTALAIRYEYKREIDSVWTTEDTAISLLARVYTGLALNTFYQVRVALQSTDGVTPTWSAYTPVQTVITNAAPILVMSLITSSSAKAAWNALSQAASYILKLTNLDSGVVVYVPTTFTDHIFTALSAGTHYSVTVKPIYAGGYVGAESNEVLFTTAGSATAATNYTHFQTTPATVWTIHHNLGFNPNIETVDEFDVEINGTQTWPDLNTAVVTFSTPHQGKAYCS